MAEPAEREETEMTDHDLLIQVAVMALGHDDVSGEDIIRCIVDLGRGDLVDEARETKALMEMAEETTTTAPAEPAPPEPTEETPTDGP